MKVGKKGRVLKNQAHASLVREQWPQIQAGKAHPACIRIFKPCKDAQQRGLSTS